MERGIDSWLGRAFDHVRKSLLRLMPTMRRPQAGAGTPRLTGTEYSPGSDHILKSATNSSFWKRANSTTI